MDQFRETFRETFDRARRVVYASACFLASVFVVHKGHTFEAADFALIVPVMCVGTGLVLSILGLAVFVKSETSPA
jgi:hypothetical protein